MGTTSSGSLCAGCGEAGPCLSFRDFSGLGFRVGSTAVKGRVEEGGCRAKSFGNPDEEVVRSFLLGCRLGTSCGACSELALGRQWRGS